MRYAPVVGTVAVLTLGFIGAVEAQDSGSRGSAGQTTMSSSPRPRFGITVDVNTHQYDSIGAYVEAVTPGGPAHKAGIRSGDIITRLNGQSLSATAGQTPPGSRLIARIRRLAPNDTAAIEFRRGKVTKTASIILPSEREREFVIQGSVADDSKEGWSLRIVTDESDTGNLSRLFSLIMSPLAALETAPLNPELGQYFGTTEGVLVISVPSDSRIPLKGGDVILVANGIKPSDPNHFMRILRSGKSGEPIKLDILRNRKRLALTIKLN